MDTEEDELITLADLGVEDTAIVSDTSLSVIEDSFEGAAAVATGNALQCPKPSTSGLYPSVTVRRPIQDDFDSDDSMKDVTWLPTLLRNPRRVSSSSESPTQEQPEEPVLSSELREITGPNVSLREVINRKVQCKPRRSLKQRRSEINVNKKLRNTGKAYTTKGVERPGRKMKELEYCILKCRSRVPEETIKILFESYWALGDYQLRVNYISSLITVEEKKTQKLRSKKKRECSHLYFVKLGQDFKERVCKKCFCAIFDETHRFVSLIASKKKKSMSGIIDNSLRGKFSNIKWSEETLIRVRDHILSFPQYESHYGRGKTNKMFLPSHLNLKLMYKLYCEMNAGQDCVSKTIYSKIFKSMNLSFKKPKVDTCSKCDLLQAKIKFCLDENEKQELEAELKKHQLKAENAYAQKRIDKENAQQDDSLVVLTFDLQQCLPTPMLSSGLAFYKRSLWTFNLTVHETKTNKATCYMWHEAIGKRGGNQIASCVYHYIKSLPETVKHVILYSDTCGGQNKNSFVSAMFLTVLSECPHIQTIDHKFLVPGHTHMECDSDHAIIEKAKKHVESIHHPRDWYQLVRSAGGSGNKFTVVEMTLETLFNFEKLLKGPFVLKKLNTKKQKFHWPDVCWFRYSNNTHKHCAQYKLELDDKGPFEVLSFLRANKIPGPIILEPCSTEMLPISIEKKADLLTLLAFIDPSVHDFYRNLITSADERNLEPDNVDFEY